MELAEDHRDRYSYPPKGQLESREISQPPQGWHDRRARCRSAAFPGKRRSEAPRSVFPREKALAPVLRRRERGPRNKTGEANWRLGNRTPWGVCVMTASLETVAVGSFQSICSPFFSA